MAFTYLLHFAVVMVSIPQLFTYPIPQLTDEDMFDLVTVLGESKNQAIEIKTLINKTLEHWCSNHDLPIVCEEHNILIHDIEPPVVSVHVQGENATLQLLKCFLSNISTLLNVYNDAFSTSGNHLQMNPIFYNAILLPRMKGLAEGFSGYLESDLYFGQSTACSVSTVEAFSYRNEGQQLKTFHFYTNQLTSVINGLQYFINGLHVSV